MASVAWNRKVKEAQELTDLGAKSEFANDYSTAFNSYVRAGEIYLWLIRQDGVKIDRDRLKAAARKVLSRAETIKQVRKEVKIVEKGSLSGAEQERALEAGGLIDLITAPEWRKEHGDTAPGPLPPLPSLAPKQVQQQARFLQRIDQPLWNSRNLFDASQSLRGRQIVQRVVTDCSFVAALEVAAEHDFKWGTKLAYSPLYPKDSEGYPTWSSSATYSIRLLVNGTYRTVTIDERLPCYEDSSPMCAVGRHGNTLHVWPSLIEKAYISLKGGYDFGGSNSSIDLHALTGWIPEHFGLQYSSFQREKAWGRLVSAYKQGHLLLTVGTSKSVDNSRSTSQSNLIESHSYAVLDLREEEDTQWLTLMNPWETGHEPEVMRMSWNEACARLDSLYLNWSPGLFPNTLSWHGTWRGKTKQQRSTVSFVTRENCEVILLLTRHVTRSTRGFLKPEWIALHIFDTADEHSPIEKSVYVDSPQKTIRCQLKAGTRLIAASRQGDATECTFTLTAYSASSIAWQDATSDLVHDHSITGQWTTKSSGGNVNNANFFTNPQYRVTVKESCRLSITVETGKDVPVQAVLVWSGGKRISQMVQGDVITSSGRYTYGLAMTEKTSVKAGEHTLVVSSFEAGKVGDFTVRLQSSQPVMIVGIEAEGAGMYHQICRSSWDVSNAFGRPKNANYFHNPSWLIKIDRASLILARLQIISTSVIPLPSINLAIFRKKDAKEVASSGPYSDANCGVLVDKFRLDPGEYLLVASMYDAEKVATFRIDLYSDRRIVCEKVVV